MFYVKFLEWYNASGACIDDMNQITFEMVVYCISKAVDKFNTDNLCRLFYSC